MKKSTKLPIGENPRNSIGAALLSAVAKGNARASADVPVTGAAAKALGGIPTKEEYEAWLRAKYPSKKK
jgi:hypothetical protein